ncbi:uncharacterized protein HMPREF1541_03923 [Cyphellophora europaea CBS 101466]|uniref:Chitin-binding type-4 domain-containing protein n=1 Tax=Cyphellophora europaea (strain CBS 101466) TaxID=1220924 RepID=W2S208_CYPE1|nr:uncharacterized protein HMPREF1541_03923 [Cyphellophora europaea CBS 101466]ETN41984.1 hypothetical protein HMPREF1541_03923 [Cyphellophora europaea CBS 101466]
MLSVLLTVLLMATQSCAYVQMSWPYPLRSPRDPAVLENLKDYDLSSPLRNDGSNFACKRYQYSDTNPQADEIKAVYDSGSVYNISLVGGSTYSGGSCQISLSYDNGQTFKVIQSIIGGCPLTPNYNFTIPSFAPSSNTVLLSWSWFNLLGDRRMYQNCARVQIAGAAPSQRHRRGPGSYMSKRQSSMDELPDMFTCNIGNGCMTVEGREVVFPDPGPNVVYGQDAVVVDPGSGISFEGASTTPASSLSPSTTTTMDTTTSELASSTSLSTTSDLATSTTEPIDTTSSSTSTTIDTTTSELASPTSLSTTSEFTTSTTELNNTTSSSTFTPPFPMPNATTTTGGTMSGTLPYTPSASSESSSATYTFTSLDSTTETFTPIPSSTSSTSTDILSASSSVSDLTTTSLTATSTSTLTTSPLASSTVDSSTSSSSSSSSSSSTTIVVSSTSTLITSTSSTIVASSTFTTIVTPSPSTQSSTASSSTPTATASSLPLPCQPGTFACNSPTSFSQCVPAADGGTTYTFMGSVAAGTTCVNGQIIRENAGPCSPNGQIFCNGDMAFFMCDQGGLVSMGSTAAGTVCQNGVIVAAR